MNTATMEWLLGLSGAVIVLLLTANGYWIKRLVDSIDEIKKTINESQLNAVSESEQFQSCRAQSEDHFKVVDDRLNKHSDALKAHGEKIAVLEERMKIHKKE